MKANNEKDLNPARIAPLLIAAVVVLAWVLSRTVYAAAPVPVQTLLSCGEYQVSGDLVKSAKGVFLRVYPCSQSQTDLKLSKLPGAWVRMVGSSVEGRVQVHAQASAFPDVMLEPVGAPKRRMKADSSIEAVQQISELDCASTKETQ